MAWAASWAATGFGDKPTIGSAATAARIAADRVRRGGGTVEEGRTRESSNESEKASRKGLGPRNIKGLEAAWNKGDGGSCRA
jgi:hypothetical protein